ncbi:hypothetical protein CKO40_16330 [Halochromatium glycolicum]|uniref:NERD domain-containing protein n=3 Tax=Chromatiaceae TaxID=1046 RepID=A0AAJ0U7U2_9GAMM|nr:hypothetical protein [Halochromatium glycolicum]
MVGSAIWRCCSKDRFDAVMDVTAFTPLIQALLAPLLAVVPLALILWLLRRAAPAWRGKLGEATVARVLKRSATEVLNDVILPDGRGGLTQIDHLALTPAGIVVVETKNYRGLILGQQSEPRWTQVIGRQRHAFQNPLRQNYAHTEAVCGLLRDVPVIGYVVFLDGARFPKGRPPGVLDLDGLRSAMRSHAAGRVPMPVRQGWDVLVGAVRRDRSARKAHLAGLRQRHGRSTHRNARLGTIESRSPDLLGLGLHGGVLVVVLFIGLTAVLGMRETGDPQHMLGDPAANQRPADPRPMTGGAGSERLPSRAEQRPPAESDPPALTWSNQSGEQLQREACNLARAEVLIANTAANRAARDAVCKRAAVHTTQDASIR